MLDEEIRRFYEQHARKLWAYILRCSGSRAAADDIVQEAFLRMMTAKLPPDMAPERLRRYLYKVATNLLRRYKGARRTAELADLAADDPTARFDDALDVRSAMSELKRSEQGLLWLAYVENFSHREIARITGYRENSVRPLLHRAKNRLLSLMRRTGGTMK